MTSTILFVSYDRLLAERSKRDLIGQGYKVACAYDDECVCEAFAQHRIHPDLVIIDHLSVTMNGIITMLQIHREIPEEKVLIIGTNNTTKHLAYDYGAVDYIQRPFSSKKLVKEVNRCIEDEEISFEHGNHWNESILPKEDVEALASSHPVAGHSLRIGSMSDCRVALSQTPQKSVKRYASAVVALAVAALIFMAMMNFIIEEKLPGYSVAIISVKVHSSDYMESRDFQLTLDGEVKYDGKTGGGRFANVPLTYIWNSTASVLVEIAAHPLSVESQSGSGQMIALAPGGVYNINLYV